MTTFQLLPGRAATSATCWACRHGHQPADAAPHYTTTYAGAWRVLAWCRACDRVWYLPDAVAPASHAKVSATPLSGTAPLPMMRP